MADVELKPCPICHGKAELYSPRVVIGEEDADTNYIMPYCTACGLMARKVRFTNYSKVSEDYLKAQTQATSLWNTRKDTQ